VSTANSHGFRKTTSSAKYWNIATMSMSHQTSTLVPKFRQNLDML
jgi:hypothetical protein